MENRINDDEIKKLIKINKKCKLKIDSDKIKCIIYWGQGKSWKNIKDSLFISDGTVKSYIDKYKNGGVENLLQTNYESHNYKLNSEQESQLKEYVRDNIIIHTEQVCEFVRETFGITYTVNGMNRTLSRLGFLYIEPKNSEFQVDAYLQGIHIGLGFLPKIVSTKQNETVYFINAGSVECKSGIDYGWVMPDEDSAMSTRATKSKKICINIAYNLKTKEIITVTQKPSSKVNLTTKLVKKAVKQNIGKEKITFILYNAGKDKNKDLWKFINKSDVKIEMIYIPKYNPDLTINI